MPDSTGQSFELPKTRLRADLFTTQESRDDAQREKVQEIPIDLIDDFPDHPFQVRQDDEMQAMVESIRKYGVFTPAVVRQKDDGRFELVSGHRRKFAAVAAELSTLPAIVREMTRDEAIIFMVESNFQRETVLPSEKAFAYKMRLEAMNRQGQRTDLTCAPVGHKSRDFVAEETGDSKSQIQRFIRLTSLVPSLLQLVDDGKIAMRPAVELSYLQEKEQSALLAAVQSEDCTPSHAQAAKMRKFSEEGQLNTAVILSILQEEKPNQVEQFKMPKTKISKFFPPGTPAQKMEDTIIKALELYRQRERNRGAHDL